MEIEGPEAIVLTDRGEFERVPLGKRKLDIGMEITLPSRRRSPLLFGRTWTGWIAGAAAVLMLMAIVPYLSQVRPTGEVVAYVDIDINPSIRLAVDEDKHVVAAEALNNDGRRVLSEATIVGQGMETAVAHITEQAVEDGFINKNRKNSVMLALTPAPGKRIVLVWENRLKEAVASALQEQHQVAVVETRIGSNDLRLAASQQGLSVGNLMMLLAAREKNLPITVAVVKKNPIVEVIRGMGSSPEELAKVEHNTKEWDQIAAKYGPELESGGPTTLASTALQKPDNGKDTAGKTGETVVADGGDKPDGKTGLNQTNDQVKDPTGTFTIAELNLKGKKPKKPAESGKTGETGSGTPAAGQDADKKPVDQTNVSKTGETGNVTKPTDGQSTGSSTGTPDAVKTPVDQTKDQSSMGVNVPAGAASAQAPADTNTENNVNAQATVTP